MSTREMTDEPEREVPLPGQCVVCKGSFGITTGHKCVKCRTKEAAIAMREAKIRMERWRARNDEEATTERMVK